MAKLNTEVETTKHEKLIKVLDIIRQCDKYIAENERQLQLPKSANIWNFSTEEEMHAEIAWKTKVRNRISAYYAKQVFALAGNAYTMVNEERMPQSQSPIIQS